MLASASPFPTTRHNYLAQSYQKLKLFARVFMTCLHIHNLLKFLVTDPLQQYFIAAVTNEQQREGNASSSRRVVVVVSSFCIQDKEGVHMYRRSIFGCKCSPNLLLMYELSTGCRLQDAGQKLLHLQIFFNCECLRVRMYVWKCVCLGNLCLLYQNIHFLKYSLRFQPKTKAKLPPGGAIESCTY